MLETSTFLHPFSMMMNKSRTEIFFFFYFNNFFVAANWLAAWRRRGAKNSFDTPFCSLIKILLNSFFLFASLFTLSNFGGERGKERSNRVKKKLERRRKSTTLTRIINFYRAAALVVASEYHVGVLHSKKCWYVEFTRSSGVVECEK